MTDSGKSVARIVALAVVTVVISLVFVSFALARRDARTYPSNVWVGGIAIGNMTREEAFAKIARSAEEQWGNTVTLALPNKNLRIPIEEMGIHFDFNGALEQVDNTLYPGEGVNALLRHSIIRGDRQDIKAVFTWDEARLNAKILTIKQQNDKAPVEARILYTNDYLEYISHSSGYTINADGSRDGIVTALRQGSLGPVPMAISETHPRVKLDDIKEVKDVLGISLTHLPGSSNQYKSIVERMNGLIVMPADGFSLPTLLGKEWAASGNAGAVIEDALIKACLQAGIIIEGSPPCFNNGLAHPVLITAVFQEDSLLIRVFGCQTEAGKEIGFVQEKRELMPEVKITVNRRLSPTQRLVQQEGKSGYIERTYRVVKVHGETVEKTLLSENVSPASDTLIMVGPGNVKK